MTSPIHTGQPITFTLAIDGQPMQVRYIPNYITVAPYGRFAFTSPHKPPGRIPVSETGYKSHFAPMHEIAAAPSPQEYAHALALALIRAAAARNTDQADDDQFALF